MEALVDNGRYGQRVLALFEQPSRAGSPAGANYSGEAASAVRGSRVRFELRVAKDAVEAAGFFALGCPHTIAAAAVTAGEIEGHHLDELANYVAGSLQADLPLPAEKLDIRILIEDAVRNISRMAGET